MRKTIEKYIVLKDRFIVCQLSFVQRNEKIMLFSLCLF